MEGDYLVLDNHNVKLSKKKACQLAMKLTRRKAMKEKNRKNMKRIRERVEKKKKNEKIERRWNKVEEGKTKKRTKKRMGVAVEEEKDVKEMGMKKTYKRVVNEEESEKEKDDNTKPVPSDCTSDHEFQGMFPVHFLLSIQNGSRR
ncbi:hypothetical protein Tcan_07179 [Toxocara canis]|uniref:Uncharacterized protein n=1 Tax=Toxocara canis TaxID=6265 RepID=A0A0B2VK28_TOXCA|nr:hypothetical protein Tcan_07179 [Toxocara canis]